MLRKLLLCALAPLYSLSLSLQAQTPTVPSPQQTDQIILDPNSNGKADPGDKIRYKVTIQNTGSGAATGAQLNAVPDSRTTLDGASFRTSPLAFADSYACTGNVGLNVPSASGLKANDFDDNPAGLTVLAETKATTQSGSVTIAADGSFTYTPPAGFTGVDGFTYTLEDGNEVSGVAATDGGAVTITVSNLIWFVDNTGGGSGGDGRRNSPFKTLADFNAGSTAAGDVVYLEHTGTDYTGGIVLQNNERLFGEGHTGGANLANVLPFVLAANSVALPAINGSRPILTNSGGNGITLASGNTINGVSIDLASGAKIAGTNFGTLTTSNITMTGAGAALNLDNGNTSVTITTLASTSSVTAIRLNNVTGNITVGTSAGTGISGATGPAVEVIGGSVSLTYNPGITQANNAALLSVSGGHTGTLSFQSFSLTATNGTGLVFDNADGTYNINVNTTLNGGAAGVSITNGSDGNFTFSPGVSITNPSGAAFLVSGGGGTVNYEGSISKNNAGRSVDIQSRTGGSVTMSGNLSSTGTSTGINVSSCTGGTVTFSGSTKTINTGANTAVTLSSNTGATINFTGGGLAITTTSGTGFSATGGGTVTVQGTGNTINSTSATALNVTSTTIGASGLTFQSISSGNNNASADPANGIFLSSTGTSGGLTVTGDGSNTTKGGNASGGTIQNIFGSDATTAGIGIYLNNTANVVLRRMTINGTLQNNGIYGESVRNLTLQYCTVGGAIGTTSGSNDLTLECPVQFGKTFPSVANGFANGSTATIDNCLISGGIQHNMEFYQVGNTASVTISNCNITSNGAALGSDGIQIETHTDSNGGTAAANFTVSVQSCLFDDNKSQALQASALGDSFMDITINNCTVQKTTQGNEGFVLQNGGDGDMTAHVTNNILTGILGTNIFLGQVAGNANAGTNLIGVISGNTMTVGAVGGPYPTNRTLIVFLSSTVGQVSNANILVHGNTIHTQSQPGTGLSEPLFVSTPDADTDPSFTATVTNNVVNINDPGAAALRGIAVQSTQAVSAGCFDVRGNDVNYTPSAPSGVNGLRVRQAGSGTAQLEQGASSGAAAAVLAANNPLCTTEVVGTVTVVSNGTCQEPPN